MFNYNPVIRKNIEMELQKFPNDYVLELHHRNPNATTKRSNMTFNLKTVSETLILSQSTDIVHFSFAVDAQGQAFIFENTNKRYVNDEECKLWKYNPISSTIFSRLMYDWIIQSFMLNPEVDNYIKLEKVENEALGTTVFRIVENLVETTEENKEESNENQ